MSININNVIARAQRMMLDENWNRQVEMGAAAHRAGSMNGKSNSDDLKALEEAAFGSSSSQQTVQYTPIPENFKMNQNQYNDRNNHGIEILQETVEKIDPKKTKLPKAIIDEFTKNPSPLIGMDEFNTPPQSFVTTQSTPLMQQIVEQKPAAQPYQPNQYQPTFVDYNYIKHLIDESIKEHLTGMLNENVNLSTMKGMRIENGGVIQFVDSKGNIFEGKLTLKKRANSK